MRKQMLIIPCFMLILGFASIACATGVKSEGIPVALDSPWAAGIQFNKEWNGNVVFSCDPIEGRAGSTNLNLSEGEKSAKIELYPAKGAYLDRGAGGERQVINSNEAEYTAPRTGDRGIMPYVIIAGASMVIIIALMIKKQMDSRK